MKPLDRARLTTALREHVARIAAELRTKMRAPGAARTHARQLHSDEQVAEDFDVWTDLLSRRAAVLWVLKSVYVRVLEDRHLLRPGRLLDLEAQQLFERLAPHLGETAFLRWIYRDLASPNGGLPELFSPQPAEVALPSDELSRGLITFWRHRDADTGVHWSFAEERFEGELMGDLYQELDPVVKDRFALCQTPDFVRAFILERTLTPAIEAFGADRVRLLDPACGSGHFLIDALKRLAVAIAAQHPDWSRESVVTWALEHVVGIDLNDYACALARARLVMTAGELAGSSTLAQAAQFHPEVYWADALEQVEREDAPQTLQFGLFEGVEERPRATLTRPEARAALRNVLAAKFQVVVANPPYITESDEARRTYHREKLGRKRRYTSAYREYSLGSLFTERSFQLCDRDGFVGLITGNNFTKRDFGKPLIEEVLSCIDLSLVIDLSQAYIPFHTTPTVLLFARNRLPASGSTVRVVLGKQGEAGTPDDPSCGLVWLALQEHWMTPTYDDDFITVVDWTRKVAATHEWNLQGGGASGLKLAIESSATHVLKDLVADMGAAVLTRCDDAYLAAPGTFTERFAEDEVRPFVTGKQVRDWNWSADMEVLHPYGESAGQISSGSMERWLWPLRTRLWLRREPNGNHREIGLTWWEWSRFIRRRYTDGLQIVFANVASHNHFALVRERVLLGSHAPSIRLKPQFEEPDYLALLGILNSSIGCFWLKQRFYPKGSKTHDIDREGTLPENNRYEYASTGMKKFPLPPGWRDVRMIELARAMEHIAAERKTLRASMVLELAAARESATALKRAFTQASEKDTCLEGRMVFLQEEIDWLAYELFGLVSGLASELGTTTDVRLDADLRPFVCKDPERWRELPTEVQRLYQARRAAIDATPHVGVAETPVFKRLWRGAQGVFGRYDRTYDEKARTAMTAWLVRAVDRKLRERVRPATVEQLTAALQTERDVQAVVEVLEGRQDYSLRDVLVDILAEESVPNHPLLVYSESGQVKRSAWERTWRQQRAEDGGDANAAPEIPPPYSEADFVRPEYFRRRRALDVPKERILALTEVPGRVGVEILYGSSAWTPVERLKVFLEIDEELEDAGIPLVDRIGVLDSAWQLLPAVGREDAAVAVRLKAELQAVLGPEGPSRELIGAWFQKLPTPGARLGGTRRVPVADDDEESDAEGDDES